MDGKELNSVYTKVYDKWMKERFQGLSDEEVRVFVAGERYLDGADLETALEALTDTDREAHLLELQNYGYSS